jgi:hypothetical protein
MCGYITSRISGSAIHNTPSAANLTPTSVVTQVVRFQKSTGANGTTQDVFLSFTPKAIIVFSANGTADGTNEAYYQESLGFSDGTNMSGYAVASRDAVGPTITGRQHYVGVIWAKMSLTAPNTTVTAYATCTFDTNKVTFTYPINDAEATDITLLAFGGDDITNAKVNTVSIGRNTAGTQDYTGLGFDPLGDGKSALFMLSTGSQTVGANETHALSAFGCATSTIASATAGSNQWYRTQLSEHGQTPSDTWYVSNDDRCFAVLNTTGGFSHWAFLKSWLTDGFQLQWDGPPTATDFDFSYLVINGGNWDSGTLTTLATPTNDVDTSVSVDSQPIKGLMLTGTTMVLPLAVKAYNIFSLGATDGITQSVIAGIDEDNQNPCDNYRYSSNTAIYHTLGTDGANSVRAIFDSFGTNSFRLDYPVLPVAHLVHWVVVADAPSSTLFDRPISETSVSVSEALARVQIKIKPISEPSVSVSETLARVQSLIKTINETSVSVSEALARIQLKIKPISESAISVSEALVRGLVYTRPINEPSISTNDSIVRLPLYLRPINDTPAITTNDSIARWISVSYTLAEPSISINDTIAGALFYPRTINESAISVNDSIVRLLAATRAISESSITVSDTIARIQSLIKQISESAISVNDSVQGSLLFTALLIESRIKWYYSLLTRKIV